jgi:3-methyladenine DNA glycosylase AlkD
VVSVESAPTLAGVRKRLMALGDAESAVVLQRFFKTGPGEYGEGDRFIGVRVPVLRALAREMGGLSLQETVGLLHDPVHEARVLALLILVDQYAAADLRARAAIVQVYLANTAYINNWDLVDGSAPYIVGRHLEGRSRRVLHRLARSRSLWERRIAIVSTFYFIRQQDFAETIRIAELLLEDAHDLIHKAVGWMLREVGKRDLATLESFLDRHAAVMPRTMLRYAIERLPEKARRGYLKARAR